MNKKIIFIGIIIICIVIFSIAFFLKQRNANLDYKLEIVNEINYMIFNENSKFGVINKNGEIVVQARYDEIQIPNPSRPLFICKYGYDEKKGQYNIKVFNDKSEQILYQYVIVEAIELNSGISEIPFEKSVLKYMDDGKYGLINFDGDIIIKAQYDEINSLDYNEGLLLVKKNDKYGIININGATVVKEKYDRIESYGYYEDGAGYKKSGYVVGKNINNGLRYGYINHNGKRILEEKYEQLDRIENKSKNDDIYIVAFENGKAGFYKNSENIIKHEYEDIAYDTNNDCLILQQNSKQGISDLNGNIVMDIKYDNIYISGKYVNAQLADNIEIYDYSNKQKINFENIVGMNQTENGNYSIAITNGEKFKIWDNVNNQLNEDEYDYLELIYDNYFIALKNNKFGIVDLSGNQIIDFKYDYIRKIPNSKLVQAGVNDKNLIDIIMKDKVVVSMSNCEIFIKKDFLVIQSSLDRKYVDLEGKTVENTTVFDSELYAYKQGKKWGFVNKNGDAIVEAKYDFVTEFNEYGFAGIKNNGKWGCVNIKGEIVTEPVYEIDSNNPNFVGKYYEYDPGYGQPYYVAQSIK